MSQTTQRGSNNSGGRTPKPGLGRGFDALLPTNFDKSSLLSAGERIKQIAVTALEPNPQQPRKHFDQAALQELAASLKRHGVVQPLVVTPAQNGRYYLIAGERRLRAAKLAGLDKVPVIIRDSKELEQLEVALIENVQRVDLSPLEQAISIERLHEQFNFPYDDIAKRLGKATSTIHNTVRLLGLPEAARDALAAGKISEGHARAILALKGDQERQTYLLQTIVSQGWSVRQAERFVTSVKAGIKQSQQAHARSQTETAETKALSRKLKTPVHIRRTARGGKLEIDFTSDDELTRLLSFFD